MFYHHVAVNACLAGLVCCFLAACSSTVGLTKGELPSHEVAVDEFLLKEYQIGVGDQLSVSVWRNPDLSAQVVVLPDGNISVPLVGDVRAAGATTRTLAAGIKTALNNFIREPEVTVSVVNAASAQYLRRVRITGAVNAPISIVYSRGLTVLDVVLLAGGLSPFANGNKAILYRRQGEEVKVFRLKLEDILSKGRLETNYAVLPSDVVVVPEKSF